VLTAMQDVHGIEHATVQVETGPSGDPSGSGHGENPHL
jgi:hypothetical protein